MQLAQLAFAIALMLASGGRLAYSKEQGSENPLRGVPQAGRTKPMARSGQAARYRGLDEQPQQPVLPLQRLHEPSGKERSVEQRPVDHRPAVVPLPSAATDEARPMTAPGPRRKYANRLREQSGWPPAGDFDPLSGRFRPLSDEVRPDDVGGPSEPLRQPDSPPRQPDGVVQQQTPSESEAAQPGEWTPGGSNRPADKKSDRAGPRPGPETTTGHATIGQDLEDQLNPLRAEEARPAVLPGGGTAVAGPWHKLRQGRYRPPDDEEQPQPDGASQPFAGEEYPIEGPQAEDPLAEYASYEPAHNPTAQSDAHDEWPAVESGASGAVEDAVGGSPRRASAGRSPSPEGNPLRTAPVESVEGEWAANQPAYADEVAGRPSDAMVEPSSALANTAAELGQPSPTWPGDAAIEAPTEVSLESAAELERLLKPAGQAPLPAALDRSNPERLLAEKLRSWRQARLSRVTAETEQRASESLGE